ncbi:Xylose isomerase-like TIM barrel [Polystyrenella longa]|uniref:Xylose isomerase-like TIM barrel n=1 Tax=Polystyrenella longa TaxID=2528007 RepID=A0A518CP56_9PLAN|nr:TIM barrel protein [Polystyrenella longa]QDU81007.1 Xylose isomerase-like TIM barrel [Polystyrenella longa]
MKITETNRHELNRRDFLKGSALGGLTAGILGGPFLPNLDAAKEEFQLNYILNSAMYGYTDVGTIIGEVHKTGTEYIDIWPKVHGNQREQAEEMGHDAFRELLKKHDVKLGVVTCYVQGPFRLAGEMKFANSIAGPGTVLVTASGGPKDLKGTELKSAMRNFVEKMKPHVEEAEEFGCTIAIENHANALLHSPDSIRWFGEMTTSEKLGSDRLGVALAPHHLPQDGELIGKIAYDLGSGVAFFYAQQHGMGSSKKLPKEQEMLQMPGRGDLDFTPILAALKKHQYQGFTEIFMHPVPRGVPILDSSSAITDAINESRMYLNKCLTQI